MDPGVRSTFHFRSRERLPGVTSKAVRRGIRAASPLDEGLEPAHPERVAATTSVSNSLAKTAEYIRFTDGRGKLYCVPRVKSLIVSASPCFSMGVPVSMTTLSPFDATPDSSKSVLTSRMVES